MNKLDIGLKRGLLGIASDLKWSAVELNRIAERLRLTGNEPDAQAMLRMCAVFREDEDRLAGFAAEVAGQMIVWNNAE